ncbi:hypothetical protein T492DRAFT_181636, partial [Pavlovales sp. CCMP2436]
MASLSILPSIYPPTPYCYEGIPSALSRVASPPNARRSLAHMRSSTHLVSVLAPPVSARTMADPSTTSQLSSSTPDPPVLFPDSSPDSPDTLPDSLPDSPVPPLWGIPDPLLDSLPDSPILPLLGIPNHLPDSLPDSPVLPLSDIPAPPRKNLSDGPPGSLLWRREPALASPPNPPCASPLNPLPANEVLLFSGECRMIFALSSQSAPETLRTLGRGSFKKLPGSRPGRSLSRTPGTFQETSHEAECTRARRLHVTAQPTPKRSPRVSPKLPPCLSPRLSPCLPPCLSPCLSPILPSRLLPKLSPRLQRAASEVGSAAAMLTAAMLIARLAAQRHHSRAGSPEDGGRAKG